VHMLARWLHERLGMQSHLEDGDGILSAVRLGIDECRGLVVAFDPSFGSIGVGSVTS
jgi:hypothetical protein